MMEQRLLARTHMGKAPAWLALGSWVKVMTVWSDEAELFLDVHLEP